MGPGLDSTMPRRNVLVVDDEEFLRRMLARMLDDAGFEVLEAEDGQAALKTARLQAEALSLVVTDIHMPVMNGIEFAREFHLLNPAVPVLFITGRDPTDFEDPDYLDAHLLRKPFRSEAFVAAVSRLLGDQSEPHGRDDSRA